MASDKQILEELRQIRKLLEPKPVPAAPPKGGAIKELMDFFNKYKVVGMAVAFIIGLYLGALVQALVNDIVMPIIQIVMPGSAWEAIALGPFRIGHFVGALITFLIVVIVIYLMVKMTKKWGLE